MIRAGKPQAKDAPDPASLDRKERSVTGAKDGPGKAPGSFAMKPGLSVSGAAGVLARTPVTAPEFMGTLVGPVLGEPPDGGGPRKLFVMSKVPGLAVGEEGMVHLKLSAVHAGRVQPDLSAQGMDQGTPFAVGRNDGSG